MRRQRGESPPRRRRAPPTATRDPVRRQARDGKRSPRLGRRHCWTPREQSRHQRCCKRRSTAGRDEQAVPRCCPRQPRPTHDEVAYANPSLHPGHASPAIGEERACARQSSRSPLVAKPSTERLQRSCKHSGRGEARRGGELVVPLDGASGGTSTSARGCYAAQSQLYPDVADRPRRSSEQALAGVASSSRAGPPTRPHMPAAASPSDVVSSLNRRAPHERNGDRPQLRCGRVRRRRARSHRPSPPSPAASRSVRLRAIRAMCCRLEGAGRSSGRWCA